MSPLTRPANVCQTTHGPQGMGKGIPKLRNIPAHRRPYVHVASGRGQARFDDDDDGLDGDFFYGDFADFEEYDALGERKGLSQGTKPSSAASSQRAEQAARDAARAELLASSGLLSSGLMRQVVEDDKRAEQQALSQMAQEARLDLIAEELKAEGFDLDADWAALDAVKRTTTGAAKAREEGRMTGGPGAGKTPPKIDTLLRPPSTPKIDAMRKEREEMRRRRRLFDPTYSSGSYDSDDELSASYGYTTNVSATPPATGGLPRSTGLANVDTSARKSQEAGYLLQNMDQMINLMGNEGVQGIVQKRSENRSSPADTSTTKRGSKSSSGDGFGLDMFADDFDDDFDDFAPSTKRSKASNTKAARPAQDPYTSSRTNAYMDEDDFEELYEEAKSRNKLSSVSPEDKLAQGVAKIFDQVLQSNTVQPSLTRPSPSRPGSKMNSVAAPTTAPTTVPSSFVPASTKPSSKAAAADDDDLDDLLADAGLSDADMSILGVLSSLTKPSQAAAPALKKPAALTGPPKPPGTAGGSRRPSVSANTLPTSSTTPKSTPTSDMYDLLNSVSSSSFSASSKTDMSALTEDEVFELEYQRHLEEARRKAAQVTLGSKPARPGTAPLATPARATPPPPAAAPPVDDDAAFEAMYAAAQAKVRSAPTAGPTTSTPTVKGPSSSSSSGASKSSSKKTNEVTDLEQDDPFSITVARTPKLSSAPSRTSKAISTQPNNKKPSGDNDTAGAARNATSSSRSSSSSGVKHIKTPEFKAPTSPVTPPAAVTTHLKKPSGSSSNNNTKQTPKPSPSAAPPNSASSPRPPPAPARPSNAGNANRGNSDNNNKGAASRPVRTTVKPVRPFVQPQQQVSARAEDAEDAAFKVSPRSMPTIMMASLAAPQGFRDRERHTFDASRDTHAMHYEDEDGAEYDSSPRWRQRQGNRNGYNDDNGDNAYDDGFHMHSGARRSSTRYEIRGSAGTSASRHASESERDYSDGGDVWTSRRSSDGSRSSRYQASDRPPSAREANRNFTQAAAADAGRSRPRAFQAANRYTGRQLMENDASVVRSADEDDATFQQQQREYDVGGVTREGFRYGSRPAPGHQPYARHGEGQEEVTGREHVAALEGKIPEVPEGQEEGPRGWDPLQLIAQGSLPRAYIMGFALVSQQQATTHSEVMGAADAGARQQGQDRQSVTKFLQSPAFDNLHIYFITEYLNAKGEMRSIFGYNLRLVMYSPALERYLGTPGSGWFSRSIIYVPDAVLEDIVRQHQQGAFNTLDPMNNVVLYFASTKFSLPYIDTTVMAPGRSLLEEPGRHIHTSPLALVSDLQHSLFTAMMDQSLDTDYVRSFLADCVGDEMTGRVVFTSPCGAWLAFKVGEEEEEEQEEHGHNNDAEGQESQAAAEYTVLGYLSLSRASQDMYTEDEASRRRRLKLKVGDLVTARVLCLTDPCPPANQKSNRKDTYEAAALSFKQLGFEDTTWVQYGYEPLPLEQRQWSMVPEGVLSQLVKQVDSSEEDILSGQGSLPVVALLTAL